MNFRIEVFLDTHKKSHHGAPTKSNNLFILIQITIIIQVKKR